MAADEDGLWSAILADVAAQTSNAKALPPRTLLVLGDHGVGKSALLQRLQSKKTQPDEQFKGTGIEFSYIDVKEEDSEDSLTRLGVFVFDGNSDYRSHIHYAVPPESAEACVAVIVLDMSKPWTMIKSLEQWLTVLEDYYAHIESPALQAQRARLIRDFQLFDENLSEEENEKPSAHADQLPPLEDGVFVRNLGIPVVVVCTKCDSTGQLEKEKDYRQEHFDFIQLHLRTLCLRWGAALVYNGRESRTTALLLRYIFNRAYGLPFRGRADITERDCVFVPSGWDSAKKISVLQESFKSFTPQDPFQARITAPTFRKGAVDEVPEVAAEQDFLKSIQGILVATRDPEKKLPSTPLVSRSAASTSSLSNVSQPLPVTPNLSIPNGTPKTDKLSEKVTVVSTASLPGSAKTKPPINSNEMLTKFFANILKPAAT